MVKSALDHRREERTDQVRDVHDGASAKRADDNDGPGQGQITEEAGGAEGEGRSTTTDAVDGAAALDPALVAEKLCWNCGTQGKESNLCTCRGCRKVGHQKYSLPIAQYITLNITNFLQALYCNEKCQVEDWEKHGRFCRKKTKRRQRRKEARQRGGEVNEGGDGVEGQGGLEDFDGLSINEVD